MRLPHAPCVALVIAASAALTAAAAAPPARPVLTEVFLSGDTGVPLTGLRAADFEVRVDGAEVPVVACVAPKRALAQQLTVALVVDETAVAAERRAAFAAADRVVRDILAGGRSRVMVVSWGATNVTAQPFTADPGQVARDLARPPAAAGAPGPDTLDSVVTALGSLPGRKALVVIGGAAPGAAARTAAFRSLADAANGAGATVYWIDASGGGPRDGQDPGGSEVVTAARAAAAATGGLDATGNGDLAEALFQVTRDLRGAWTVAFTPASGPDGAPHRLDVRVRREGVAARARVSCTHVDEERRIAERSAAALLLGWEDNPLGVQVSLSSEQKPGEDTQAVTVLVTIPLAGLEFEATPVSHDCDLSLWLAARDGDGKVIRAPKAKFPVSVPNDRLLTALAQTAGYTFRVPMKAGPASVAVTVRDEIGTAASTALASAAPPAEPAPGVTQ